MGGEAEKRATTCWAKRPWAFGYRWQGRERAPGKGRKRKYEKIVEGYDGGGGDDYYSDEHLPPSQEHHKHAEGMMKMMVTMKTMMMMMLRHGSS